MLTFVHKNFYCEKSLILILLQINHHKKMGVAAMKQACVEEKEKMTKVHVYQNPLSLKKLQIFLKILFNLYNIVQPKLISLLVFNVPVI